MIIILESFKYNNELADFRFPKITCSDEMHYYSEYFSSFQVTVVQLKENILWLRHLRYKNFTSKERKNILFLVAHSILAWQLHSILFILFLIKFRCITKSIYWHAITPAILKIKYSMQIILKLFTMSLWY